MTSCWAFAWPTGSKVTSRGTGQTEGRRSHPNFIPCFHFKGQNKKGSVFVLVWTGLCAYIWSVACAYSRAGLALGSLFPRNSFGLEKLSLTKSSTAIWRSTPHLEFMPALKKCVCWVKSHECNSRIGDLLTSSFLHTLCRANTETLGPNHWKKWSQGRSGESRGFSRDAVGTRSKMGKLGPCLRAFTFITDHKVLFLEAQKHREKMRKTWLFF